MTTGECALTSGTRAGTVLDARIASAGRELLDGILARPWGQVSPSVYETGRLVSLAPWLTGHGRRVRYLLDAQRPDGFWGAPGGYAVVPTLSAVEAMLSVLPGQEDGRPGVAGAVDAAETAARLDPVLSLLAGWLPGLSAADIPDMPANDLITGSLVESINERLGSFRAAPASGLPRPAFEGRLTMPSGMNGTRLAKVRAALTAGFGLPEKVLHALEVAGGLAGGARAVRPSSTGAVGASPAATAAWLAGDRARDPRHPARVFLETVVDDHDGPAPCGLPITVFERAWVLSTLARAGIAVHVPGSMPAGLDAALGPAGTPAAEGLPADADTTSATLYALGLLGRPRPPDMLWSYETETHFATWPGEDGFSVTANAHVLEAFGHYLDAVGRGEAPRTRSAARYAETAGKLVALLCDRQEPDGRWSDRWHASPYYATLCCVVALSRFGGRRAVPAIRRAQAWTLDTQRPDGSWGRWEGTAEETAYAVQILLSGDPDDMTPDTAGRYEESVTSGCQFLPDPVAGPPGNGSFEGPSLWHDKDLYLPVAIVRASILAAHHLAGKRGLSVDSR